MSRKALIIGIDDYPEPSKLVGCVLDAKNMANLLARHADGSPNFSCMLYTSADKEITQVFLRRRITDLFQSEAECVLFYFSGHGYESSGGYLVTQDYIKNNVGVSFDEMLKLANLALESGIIQEIIIILDCCHSGHMGNGPMTGKTNAQLAEGLSILTASMPDQYAVGRRSGGIFTKKVQEALKGGNSDILGNVTVADVYRYADLTLSYWEQRPMFKSHVQGMAVLRKCIPKLHAWIIRKLMDYFAPITSEYSLDPSYEPTHQPEDKEHEEIFSHLLILGTAGLVEPVDAENLYSAAVHSKTCRLTSLGRLYWRQVEAGKV